MNRDEAAAALGDIDRAQRRSAALGYSAGAATPLIVWGLVWLVCNVFCQFEPVWGGAAWGPGVLVGIAASVLLSPRNSAKRDRRFLASSAIYIGLLFTLDVALKLGAKVEQNLVASLLVAAAYMLIGVWRAARIGYVGVALAVLTLIGWYAAPGWFFLWMGVVGGGALILTGLWLRRA